MGPRRRSVGFHDIPFRRSLGFCSLPPLMLVPMLLHDPCVALFLPCFPWCRVDSLPFRSSLWPRMLWNIEIKRWWPWEGRHTERRHEALETEGMERNDMFPSASIIISSRILIPFTISHRDEMRRMDDVCKKTVL